MGLLIALLKESGLPDLVDVKDYAVSCIIALLQLVLSGTTAVGRE